jgi:nicotinate-nucleotide adenylyltransferase
MSETRDLGAPILVLLVGLAVAGFGVSAHQTLPAIGAGVAGVVGAALCLQRTLRKEPIRATAMAVAALLAIAACAPPVADNRLAWAPWALLALAASFHRTTWGPVARQVLLAVAVALVLGAAYVVLTRVRGAGLLFACAVNVLVSRPRPVAPPPVGPVVGVFGGSFDPFHLGHRAICEAALDVVQRVLVVVAARPPHKAGARELSPFHHRVAMARIGVEGLPRLEVLELENRRAGPSYTIDTLEVLARIYPPGTRFRLVLGADSLHEFPMWRSWEAILERADLIVAARPGSDVEPPPEFEGRNAPIEVLTMVPVAASSTEIRARVAGRASIDGLVAPSVAAYIRDHALYQAGEPAATGGAAPEAQPAGGGQDPTPEPPVSGTSDATIPPAPPPAA